jgi:hypothetical protein
MLHRRQIILGRLIIAGNRNHWGVIAMYTGVYIAVGSHSTVYDRDFGLRRVTWEILMVVIQLMKQDIKFYQSYKFNSAVPLCVCVCVCV